MKNIVRSLFFLLLIACSSNDVTPTSDGVSKACVKCDSSAREMAWLEAIIQQSESGDYSALGPIYAIEMNNDIIFVHQPYISSCMACRLYDCEGDAVNIATVDIQTLADEMTEQNLIYQPG